MPQGSQLLSAFGSGTSAASQFENGNYTAAVAHNNAQIANENADLATFKGTQAVNISQQRTAQTIGAQRAGAGASGVDVNSGSVVRDQQDTARIGQMDAQTITANAARSAWGFRTQAQNFDTEATIDKAKGDQGGFASLIGGGANFADKWSKYKQQGYGG